MGNRSTCAFYGKIGPMNKTLLVLVLLFGSACLHARGSTVTDMGNFNGMKVEPGLTFDLVGQVMFVPSYGNGDLVRVRGIVSRRIGSYERQLSAATDAPELTSRHVQILSYVANGLNNREIARLIGVGPDCVKAHLKTAFARLGAATRTEAVALALRLNLINRR